MTRLLPGLFTSYRVRPVDHYPALLRIGADRGRADERGGGGDGRRLDAGPVQLRLLRARVPRAPDGRRAGRGVRPRRARRRVLHPHHQRAAARPRDLPADRRRLHGPARVPPGLAARRARPDARLPGRHGRDRQRGRHRRGRRQGRLSTRAGDDPLLPRRGADPRERPDLPDGRPGAAPRGAGAARRARRQAGRRVRRQGRLHRPGRERRADRPPGRGDPAPARALDRAGAGAPLHLPDRVARRRARRAPRRPAPVRRLRRGHPHRAGRAHARRAARGVDDRQLLAGRRLEGHVGARGGAGRRRAPGVRRCAAWSPPELPGLRQGGEWSGQQQQQQQQG